MGRQPPPRPRSVIVRAVARAVVRAVVRAVARAVVVVGVASGGAAAGGCPGETPVHLYVDGFEPDHVRFETEDLGPQTPAQLDDLARRPDVDGAQRLPPGSCPDRCRAALVTVFVHNRGAQPEPPPVVRLDAPPGRPRRLPIAFRDTQIERGRIGRIRWLVELWPEEQTLTATLSSSVRLEVAPATATTPTTTTPTTTTPTTTPTTTTP
jgi:hypothetical protein